MTGELNVRQYERYYSVFEMPNVDEMDQWVAMVCTQKNQIVFKINWKHHEMSKELIKRQWHFKNSQNTDDVKLTLKFVKIRFWTTINIFICPPTKCQ